MPQLPKLTCAQHRCGAKPCSIVTLRAGPVSPSGGAGHDGDQMVPRHPRLAGRLGMLSVAAGALRAALAAAGGGGDGRDGCGVAHVGRPPLLRAGWVCSPGVVFSAARRCRAPGVSPGAAAQLVASGVSSSLEYACE